MLIPGATDFDATFTPPQTRDEEAFWYVFQENQLLVGGEPDAPTIPLVADLATLGITPQRIQFLGRWQDKPCYAADLPSDTAVPDGYRLSSVRRLYGRLPDPHFWHAGRAFHLTIWARRHQFCGRCGTANVSKVDERARHCPQCGLVAYPRISPAVIVAIVRDGKILLARSQRHASGFYSVLAGFVEPGETLEDCVRREVREEVNIDVTDIRYFGSQPWPFPDSLMIAFTARYRSGVITPDLKEIADAGWYAPDALPERIPGALSVSRSLINWFVAEYSR